jgi:hypothetical protein
VPKHTSLDLPNARWLPIDRLDVEAHSGPLPIYMQREQVKELTSPDIALAFNQLRHAGPSITADLKDADSLPRAQLGMQGGASYLVSNLPEAIDRALKWQPPRGSTRMVLPPRKVLN